MKHTPFERLLPPLVLTLVVVAPAAAGDDRAADPARGGCRISIGVLKPRPACSASKPPQHDERQAGDLRVVRKQAGRARSGTTATRTRRSCAILAAAHAPRGPHGRRARRRQPDAGDRVADDDWRPPPASGDDRSRAQIAIELYAPLPGGLAAGGRFAPSSVKVPGLHRSADRRRRGRRRAVDWRAVKCRAGVRARSLAMDIRLFARRDVCLRGRDLAHALASNPWSQTLSNVLFAGRASRSASSRCRGSSLCRRRLRFPLDWLAICAALVGVRRGSAACVAGVGGRARASSPPRRFIALVSARSEDLDLLHVRSSGSPAR